jgi:FAD/FMN-containing dehydrogenase
MTLPWVALRSRLGGGQVLTPADAGAVSARSGPVPSGPARFDRARLGWNSRFDTVLPQAIVHCATARDVAETIAFADRYGIELAVRSGGHCFAGHSTGQGVVVDVSPMRSVRVTATSRPSAPVRGWDTPTNAWTSWAARFPAAHARRSASPG